MNTSKTSDNPSLSVIFSDVARQFPNKIAVRFQGQTITYLALDQQSNRLSRLLVDAGIQPGNRVGVLLNRSIDLIVSLLAIIKTGAAYMPIDSQFPADRAAFMLTDSGCEWLLTNEIYTQKTGLPIQEIIAENVWPTLNLFSDADLPMLATGQSLLYVLYTSGTTGKPKGALTHQQGVLNVVQHLQQEPGFSAADKTIALATIAFDLATIEIYLPLLTGAELVLADTQTTRNGQALSALLQTEGITFMQATPSTWRMLGEAGWRGNRGLTVISCAEALSLDLARTLLTDCQSVWNFYGPTETTIYATGGQITTADTRITIGKPISQTQVFIVDEAGNILPDGETGELWIAGTGLANGYQNQPELTIEKFIDFTLTDGTKRRVYRTGDLGRRLPDATIDFLGRRDDQVKIRGHRIELGEVERTIGQLPSIGQVVVLARPDSAGQPQLVAYLVASKNQTLGNQRDTKSIRDALAAQLPAVMIPAAFVWLDIFPVNANGKVDKSQLPEPSRSRRALAENGLLGVFQPPKTPLEKTIAAIWCALLGFDEIGLTDNFFEFGGNSLLAQKMITALKQAGYELPITKLYQFPTVSQLSAISEQLSVNNEQLSVNNEQLSVNNEQLSVNNEQLSMNSEQLSVNNEHLMPSSIISGKLTTDNCSLTTDNCSLTTDNCSLTTDNCSLITDNCSLITDIAIIGMAGRFPGANGVDELWEVLKAGQETVHFFADDELHPSISQTTRTDSRYVKARGIIDGAENFDAAFFGITPNQARLMDPQQRVFLEIAYQVLEQTGYLPQHFSGKVGVFAGTGTNTYYLNNVLPNHNLVADTIGAFQTELLNEKDYVATRTAYTLNLTGPAVSVFSACSTSLLAVSQAVQSLRSGQCAVALAGAASITAPINSGHLYQEGAMFSRDGHTNSFGNNATGTVFSDGAGVVLLKPLEAAQHDGDTIWAIIKGVGISNDGSSKGSFMAPSAEGQAAAISMALADGGIDPATIGYVEAHGTATPIGDPIEIEGLRLAFGNQSQKQFCAIGSIKSNLGHLTAASGVAGLIKTALALHHCQLPPSVGFSAPNPAIDFENSPFFVNDGLRAFTTPNRAGVSSFGVGGTNVHVILEEAPVLNHEPQTANSKPQTANLITWSAKTATSAANYAQKLASKLRADDTLELVDIAYTLQTTRPSFGFRQFVVAQTTAELLDKLTNITAENEPKMSQSSSEVVFLFPGQSAQYLNMARSFYDNEPVFREAVDNCAERLTELLDTDIRNVLYPKNSSQETDSQAIDEKNNARLNDTRYTQPALFVTEYALARLWMSKGILPTVLCGHSIGEFVAAHLAGVFSLDDALTVVAMRGRLVSEQPRGSMLSVRQNAETLKPQLPETLSLAAVNSRNLCVVSGPDAAVTAFAETLTTQAIPNKRLPTSHAFHSDMMEPVAGALAEVMAKIALSRPQKPIVSTLTGTFLTDAQATDPQYWARHLRQTVQFATALDTIFTLDNPLLLDVGPGRISATLARQQAAGRTVSVVVGLDPATDTDWDSANRAMLTTLGQLWQQGLPFYSGNGHGRQVLLPTYAFDKQRYWVEPPMTSAPRSVSAQTESAPMQLPVSSPITEPETVRANQKMQKLNLLNRINELLESTSGFDVAGLPPTTNFLEMGFDSLLLTQLATTFRREFGVPITFRQLATDLQTPSSLADYLSVNSKQLSVSNEQLSINNEQLSINNNQFTTNQDTALGLIAQQLELLTRQVALLQGNEPLSVNSEQLSVSNRSLATNHLPRADTPKLTTDHLQLTTQEAAELKKPFGATARIDRQITAELTERQQQFLQDLTARYNKKTAGSKAYTEQNRPQMADPRVVSGFRPLTKEVVYPIVVNRSRGSRLWDIDGNEYIDALNGFGSNMFGYQPDFIREALHNQIEAGFEVGPQHELAGRVTNLICEMTCSDRAALCSTGSEAVLGAMRIARTVTGRSLIVAFTGSYHGINDEVLVRGTKKLKTFPAAAGIMPEAVQNMLILDYGTPESLEIIRQRASELAAVLVEPVQSRRPDFLPTAFLQELRAITTASETALIFDEVITGFRMNMGGMQAILNIQADLITYGKVVGAGLPIGVIAGKQAFMDALDGGQWQFGDDSIPEIGVTYFAGTFVRHPLALAAALASLTYIRQHSPALQNALNTKTKRLVDGMNALCKARQLPILVAYYGSLWKLKFTEERPYTELLFTIMREKGIHIWDGFPCFVTEALTETDLNAMLTVFSESIIEMIDAGFWQDNSLKNNDLPTFSPIIRADAPPIPGAKLGRDQHGNPAWFVPNEKQPGKFLQIAT
jgi:amino acid adenylation domain-containing protein